MAVEIPTEAIKQLQISLRKQAKMSSYDPDDTSLPNLPSPEDTISEVDPSPPYLRCKNCKGRLLRGVKSLICVFCGAETCKDLPPDPIDFRNTLGFQWLLKSLALDGSEVVDQPSEANESSRGQSAAKEDLKLSELLSVEIRWTSKFEKSGGGVSDEKTPPRPRSFMDLAGVNLDSFFSEGEKDAALNASEEPFEPSTRPAATESSDFQRGENRSLFASEEAFDPNKSIATAENNAFKSSENLSFFAFDQSKEIATIESSAFQGSGNLSLFASEKPFESSKQSTTTTESTPFQGNETLSLFENMQPSETAAPSTQGESGESISSWPESFQSASPENLPKDSKSLDPFVGSTVDLSAHIDTMFGSVGDSTNVKSNHSTSTSNDWFSDDLLSISNSGLAGQPQQVESLATAKDDRIAENANNLYSTGVDWVEDTQWQTTSRGAPDTRTADEDDDSFGAWNDFTSSSGAQNPSSSSKQTFDQTTPAGENSVTNLFNKAGNSQDDDSFGEWNDFTSLTNAQNASGSSKQIIDQTAPADETSQPNLFSTASNSQADDSFGAWNDFTSLTSSQNASGSSKQIIEQTAPADEASVTNMFSTASNSQADDSFGAWNDFTSSSSTQNASSYSEKTVDQKKLADDSSVTLLFSTNTTSQDLDFGSFLQPDISAGASSSSHGSTPVRITQPEASGLDRMANAATKDDGVKDEGDVFSAKAGSKSEDVEKIMSQMHDLSFMLESNLSIPPKRDVHSLSQDHT